MLTSLGAAKLAVNVISSIGVSRIVSDIIKNNTVVLTTVQKVTVGTGSFVISAMLVDHSWKYVNDQIDQLVNMNKKDQNNTDENKPGDIEHSEVRTLPTQ